uniref:DUF4064 domain-containing protein n=1 Tax=candidate division WWE3 bacterium TaxID=2053526 RepID=A0A7C4XV67_UNCKA
MTKEIASSFEQGPSSGMGWWAFSLSLVAFLSGPLLGIFASVVRPVLDVATSENIGQVFGFLFGVLILATIVASFALSLISFQKGERSWAVWFALVVSSLAVCFLLFMLIGEFAFPH